DAKGDALLHRACANGIIAQDGDEFVVRSPALLALVADGSAAGIPIDGMLNLAASLRGDVTALAAHLADLITGGLITLLEEGRASADVARLLQRGRLLLIQAAASTLADQLGAALQQRAATADAEAGPALASALDQIRIGATADAAGTITHH